MTVTAFTSPTYLPIAAPSSAYNPKGKLAALSDGSFIAYLDAMGNGSGFALQRYDYTGTTVIGSIGIQAPDVAGYTAGIADVEELIGGGFAVAFSLLNPSGSESGAVVRFYSADGTPTSSFINAVPAASRPDNQFIGAKSNFALASAGQNNVYITYNDASEYSTQGLDVRGALISNNGSVRTDPAFGSVQTAVGYNGAASSVYDSRKGDEAASEAIRLSNGSIAVAYYDTYDYNDREPIGGTNQYMTRTRSRGQISVHFVLANGTSQEIVVDRDDPVFTDVLAGDGIGSLAGEPPAVIALSNGGFAVVWLEGRGYNSNRQFSGFSINAKMFDANGNPTTSILTIDSVPTINGTYSQPNMQFAALPSGGFALLKNVYNGSSSSSTLSVFNSFGQSSETQLNVRPGGSATIDLEVASDGSLLVSTLQGFAGAGTQYQVQRYIVSNGLELVRTGDAATNSLNGGSAADHLNGADGNDALDGLAGNDVLVGGAGNDALIGGIGADWMYGGTGDDVYSVDNTGDVVYEAAGAGYDTVYSSIAYALPANVEALIFTGSADVNATGDNGGNVLIGNAGRNVLTGGGGDDIYGVDGNGDTVVELVGGGYDEVYSSGNYAMAENVETLFLTGSAIYATGNTANNALVGNDLDNVIDAGAGTFEFINGLGGNDLLIGGAGHDEINGGAGNDTFRFTALQDAGDFFYDFTPGQDMIQLNAAAFGIGTAANPLVNGRTFINGPDVTTAAPTLLYTRANGTLFYDADGTGSQAPVVLAILNGTPALSASDITVY